MLFPYLNDIICKNNSNNKISINKKFYYETTFLQIYTKCSVYNLKFDNRFFLYIWNSFFYDKNIKALIIFKRFCLN